MKFKTISDILAYYRVHSFKSDMGELIAIRKGGYWLWFGMRQDGYYRQTGSTLRFR